MFNLFNSINGFIQAIFFSELAHENKPPEIIPPYMVQAPVEQSTTSEKIKIWFAVNGIYLVIGFFLHLLFL